ncbi:uncharacterized protein BXZ73DRAFT_76532 [Epithele typhae]|uniref:uncharacterized protein n=1 Tax=Epithele typhae TaxID=378194 RepID=UPI002007EE86|nr:uncharacterized protein BXZ73DRAFT_76532 [Epithele typhae]KAH9937912.1 hypothetical protein BXZ73DRAFT_76532 [Epithele typhae]
MPVSHPQYNYPPMHNSPESVQPQVYRPSVYPAYTPNGVDYSVSDLPSRGVARTPSPTPSEARALSGKTRMCNLRALLHPRTFKRINRQNIVPVIAGFTVAAALIVMLALHSRIEDALEPAARQLRNMPAGWLIPIAILIVLSIPPLFGHEIIAFLVGDVWGVGIGFGIVAAGTILGELLTFFIFKYSCTKRGRKLEETQLKFALYSGVVRGGGIIVPIVMRYSAIPGHMTTAVFAMCGMRLWVFLLAATLSLPKQLALVFIGDDRSGRIVKIVVIVVIVLVTIGAMRYIGARVDAIKQEVIYARRKASYDAYRQAKQLEVDADEVNAPKLSDASVSPAPAQ